MDLPTYEWESHKCKMEWPKEADYGSVLMARSGRRILAYLVADAKPFVAYSLREEEVPQFHAAVAGHWYEELRAGSFTVMSGTISKGGAVRPLPPLPPLPIGQPKALLAHAGQRAHAAADQFESIAASLASLNELDRKG